METLEVRREPDGVAVVALHRPERANALTRTMFDELVAACAALDADDGVRVVVLTGSGRAFCAGYDIDDAPSFAAALETEARAQALLFADPRVHAAVEAVRAGRGRR